MSKEIFISSTPHETRLAIVENDALSEIYYERENEYTLAGSIYNGKVTRVLPGMQSSFVDIGLERDAFLYVTDFMEEAGDSADFDTDSANGSGSKGERRPARALEARPETTVEGNPETRSEGRNEGRNEGRGEGRRGGRRRRPNDRPDFNAPAQSTDEPQDFVAEEVPATPPVADGTDAEAAEGSRRWRGRRGRRRGRGSREGAPETTPGVVAETDAEPLLYGQAEEANLDLNAEESSEETYTEAPPEVQAAPEYTIERPRTERPEGRGGRDRGRGRDGRNGRGGRDQRGGREREPREERSSFAAPVYGQEEDAPAGEPIILPGESISKYRVGGDPNPAPVVAPPTDVLSSGSSFEVKGWDGGLVLPGETIRPRTPSAGGESRQESPRSSEPRRSETSQPKSEARPEGRTESRRDGRGGRNEGRRDGRGGNRNDNRGNGRREDRPRNPRPDQPAVSATEFIPVLLSEVREEASLRPATSQNYEQRVQPVETLPEHIPFVPTPVTTFQAPVIEEQKAAPVHEPVDTVAVSPVPEQKPAEPVEFEPREGDAANRIDAPRSSFRRWRERRAAEKAAREAAKLAALEALNKPEPPAHEFTTMQPTGELLSRNDPAHEAAIDAFSSPATPIAHEAAVQSVPLAGAVTTPVPAVHTHSFGQGMVEEEEEFEEDDLQIESLHAHAEEDNEEMEEETLEGGPELGTLLREVSIEGRTRAANEEADDLEDTDEPFSEEDGESSEDSDATAPAAANGEGSPRRERSDRGDRGRRDSGRRDRNDRGGDRSGARRTGGSGGGGRGGRPRVQASDLPAISDLLKPGQEILVQIAKEPIAKKGARITSHIALPGRFLVFMPTVNHTGVSRKISSDEERRRLKTILLSEKGDATGGFIVRTAADGASEEELRSDLRFLINLWSDIKSRSESSKSPALIYHDLNLVERILRDQVGDNFSAIWVDTEAEYERVLRFLQRFQPSLIRRVKLYTKETPLFEQFGVTAEIDKALKSKVWLKSGGSIVINQTEALVAIDVNTGKYVGKTTRLEDTIVKTNLDAIPEIVRQIRLRDLGGIIVIDFIDMDDRKNRNKVMQALDDELKTDRAPSKVLQFNDFGLVIITRKRVRQSLERTLSTQCTVCTGTGMVKSPITVANEIFIEMRKMYRHMDKGDMMLRVHPEVVKTLKASGSRWLLDMEELTKKTILVKSDPSLSPEQFDIH
ncbi:Rne/Rng family ribonuclease [Terriglobus saanensis]|uniref:Ribonuclease, Rne/Rng family n=1 Tax=Terriglobus saanensis (strain ATCC BAA-1853 / DSM 23119 / SP1PR4) TaxID=401053 RepID=E8V7M1_TERSS|nr:Rne/Rng family ribonuclease [Terriglobus saanensis]ADV81719.1 ribonuclease, Rne/Rng family [Terriglobus saanensis SP1PR4]